MLTKDILSPVPRIRYVRVSLANVSLMINEGMRLTRGLAVMSKRSPFI